MVKKRRALARYFETVIVRKEFPSVAHLNMTLTPVSSRRSVFADGAENVRPTQHLSVINLMQLRVSTKSE